MPERITSFLENDHGRLLGLFREFQSANEGDLEQRRTRFNRFCREMDRHGRWVGTIIISRIEGRIDSDQQETLEQFAGKEPDRIEGHINEIRNHLEDGNTDTDELEEQLLSTLQDHFNKEERILYPLFDEHLKGEEVSELLSKFNKELSDE